MEILKFIRSFNNLNTYLLLSITILMVLVSFFYFVNPS
ncbi:hypothetical protein [Acinetobacter sp. P8-3-8]|nr:hypothetical protein [Acinetobacter sp. P8-3-8]